MAAISGSIAALSRAACSGVILLAVGVDAVEEDVDPPEGVGDPDWPLPVLTEQPAIVIARNAASAARCIRFVIRGLLEVS
jgi:hypothetical protein